jgi:spore coat polysaccharide biosynthesis predicted glycosyltransferase SpsG
MAGGDDASGLLPWLMQHLPPHLKLTVITGNPATQTALQTHFPQHQLLGRVSPEELCHLMQSHDLLISAAGQTLHEAAHLGLPALGIVVSADQALHLRALVIKGVCPVYLERHQADLAEQLRFWLQQLTDPHLRQRLSQRGKAAIPAGGAERLLKELETLTPSTR